LLFSLDKSNIVKVFLALAISLLLHIGLFFYLKNNEIEEINEKTKQNKEAIVRVVKLLQASKQQNNEEQQKALQQSKTPPLSHSPKVTQQELQPLSPQPKIQQQIEQEKPKIVQNEQKPQTNEPTKQPITEQNKETKKELPQEVKKESKIDGVTKSYLELYKDDFDSFSEETKVYLIKNLKDIGFLTERHLIYPHISIDAKQQGINVIEFWLFPDGKISKPKTIKSSSYFLLDDNSEETILKAYRDYPRPNKPTVIRIYVKYKLI
jgi:periplasmic protein TonB